MFFFTISRDKTTFLLHYKEILYLLQCKETLHDVNINYSNH